MKSPVEKRKTLFCDAMRQPSLFLCEKIGFFLFDFAKFFYAASKRCILRSRAKDRVEKALDDYNKRDDIGKKVMDYDRGIADVISEPVKTLKKKDLEIVEAKKTVSNTLMTLSECYRSIGELYDAYCDDDMEKMGRIFEHIGLPKRVENRNRKD